MTTPLTRAAHMRIAVTLAEFDYLTGKHLHAMESAKLVISLASRSAILPRVYTLTANGYRLLALPQARRVWATEEQQKAGNLFFLQHTIAVTDVLIGARLLSRTHPEIVLTRMLTERSLKRKIYVAVPAGTGERPVCIEPDASCEFTIQGNVEDFFHIEVYRTLPPTECRFKQKINRYVTAAETGQHEQLFATPALSIAVFAQTPQMARTLKRWTEEALQGIKQPAQGERFFFRSIDPVTASPEELFFPRCGRRHVAVSKPHCLFLNDKMAL